VLTDRQEIELKVQTKSRQHADLLDKYALKLTSKLLFTSHSAAASACAIVVAALVHDYGTEKEVKEYWKELYTRALPAKAFWNLYIKQLLK